MSIIDKVIAKDYDGNGIKEMGKNEKTKRRKMIKVI